MVGGFAGGTVGSACGCPITCLMTALLSFESGWFGAFNEPVWLLSWAGVAVCGATVGAVLGYGLVRRDSL